MRALRSPLGFPAAVLAIIIGFLALDQLATLPQQAMIGAVRRGDTVVTSGGFIAKVTKVIDANEIEIELAEGVRVRLVRSMIVEVRSKSEPVKDAQS